MDLKGVYSIYDNAAQAYLMPFFQDTDGLAIRLFKDCCTDHTHRFYTHAADFTLFRIADWDQISGQITPLQTLDNLGNAIQFAQKDV